jgi:PAS domain S-box-containing protein
MNPKIHTADPQDRSLQEEVIRLREENAFLMEKIRKFSKIESQLAEARHRNDRNRDIQERLRMFLIAGLKADSRFELAQLACDTAVYILECEMSFIWCYRSIQGCGTSMIGCQNQNFSMKAERDLLAWSDGLNEDMTRTDFPPLPESLELSSYCVEAVREEDGGICGLLIAANTKKRAAFHEPLNEQSTKILGSITDQMAAIMESRRRQELISSQIKQIQISEERLNLALRAGNVGLWDWDYENCMIYYSSQWKRQLGYEDHEISSGFMEWQDRLHPDDREHALSVVKGFLVHSTGDQAHENIFRLRHKDGSWRWIQSMAFVMRNEKGAPTRVIGTHIDITDYKSLEAALRSAKDIAEKSSKAKTTFLAKVNHEIRTPLNGILGSIQLLETTDLEERQRQLIHTAFSSIQWMHRIIGESLDVAKIEAGKLELNNETFSLKALLDEISLLIRSKCEPKQLRYQLQNRPGLPDFLVGDSSRIRQILDNLLSNAVKYTFRGFVKLSVSPSVTSKGVKAIRFAVTDSGIGISKEFLNDIFLPFTQLNPTDSHNGGVGLGLTITKELVSLMRGEIQVQRRRSGGTRFIVTLPLKTDMNGGTLSGTARQCSTLLRGKALVVEDDPISRELLTIMLEQLGLEVSAASDGIDGLRMLNEDFYDIGVVDCWMPRMDGRTMTRALRRSCLGKNTHIPIIALTANAQAEDVRLCHEAGMNDVLTKPLYREALIECFTKYLPNHHLKSDDPLL